MSGLRRTGAREGERNGGNSRQTDLSAGERHNGAFQTGFWGVPQGRVPQGRGELRDQPSTGRRSPANSDHPQAQWFVFQSACALFSWSASRFRKSFTLIFPSSTFWKFGSLSALEIVFQSGR